MIMKAADIQEISKKAILHQAINDRIIEEAKTGHGYTIIEFDDPLYKFIRENKELQQDLLDAGYRTTNFDEYDDPRIGYLISWLAVGDLFEGNERLLRNT